MELPTLPLTATTVPAIGAFSVVPSTASRAVSTANWAVVTWVRASVVSVPAASARSRAALAASRLACAAVSCRFAAVGFTLARTVPWVTRSPTLTRISLTVPPVVKVALAVAALRNVPAADTVAVTVPCPTGIVRVAPPVAAELDSGLTKEV